MKNLNKFKKNTFMLLSIFILLCLFTFGILFFKMMPDHQFLTYIKEKNISEVSSFSYNVLSLFDTEDLDKSYKNKEIDININTSSDFKLGDDALNINDFNINLKNKSNSILSETEVTTKFQEREFLSGKIYDDDKNIYVVANNITDKILKISKVKEDKTIRKISEDDIRNIIEIVFDNFSSHIPNENIMRQYNFFGSAETTIYFTLSDINTIFDVSYNDLMKNSEYFKSLNFSKDELKDIFENIFYNINSESTNDMRFLLTVNTNVFGKITSQKLTINCGYQYESYKYVLGKNKITLEMQSNISAEENTIYSKSYTVAYAKNYKNLYDGIITYKENNNSSDFAFKNIGIVDSSINGEMNLPITKDDIDYTLALSADGKNHQYKGELFNSQTEASDLSILIQIKNIEPFKMLTIPTFNEENIYNAENTEGYINSIDKDKIAVKMPVSLYNSLSSIFANTTDSSENKKDGV